MQPPSPPALDFLEALAAKSRTAEIRLGGEARTIPRARLGLHYELASILEGGGDLTDLALRYVSRAAAIEEDAILADEVAPAFAALQQLNLPVGVAAIAKAVSKGRQLPAFNYRGRGMAALIHDLAFAYGWTPDYILNELGPEETWCYLQEAHLTQHEQRDFEYSLSDVGRDKRGRQKRYPDLPWTRVGYDRPDQRRRAGSRPPPAQRPTGTVIDLNEIAQKRRRTA